MNYKKIAVISYHTCPLSDEKDAQIGGMNTYILELSKAMAKMGFSIDIYTRLVDINSSRIVNIAPNLRVIHLPAGNCVEIPKNQLAKYIPEFLESFFKFTRENNLSYNLTNAHYYLSGLVALQIKKRFKIPLYITFHTLALMKNLVAKNKEEQATIARVKSELLLCRLADKVIATSKTDCAYINSLYNCPMDKIAVLTPGVDLKKFRPIDKKEAKKAVNADPNQKIILFVGRIEPLKGIDVALYAIKILLQEKCEYPFCLWIVGGNNIAEKKEWSKELKRLEEIRKILNIESYVRFLGKKQRSELPFYYNASEVVIMPSQYESFGITALEAMACSIPVITTDVTGISSSFDNESLLITSTSNPIMLAEKIKKLLTQEPEYKKINKNILKQVRDLSWDNIANKAASL